MNSLETKKPDNPLKNITIKQVKWNPTEKEFTSAKLPIVGKIFPKSEPTNDSIVNSVINQFIERSKIGFAKYDKTLDRNDLTALEWLKHSLEEQYDNILYTQKLYNTLVEKFVEKEELSGFCKIFSNDQELGKIMREKYGR